MPRIVLIPVPNADGTVTLRAQARRPFDWLWRLLGRR
jgi:hypothetical protein